MDASIASAVEPRSCEGRAASSETANAAIAVERRRATPLDEQHVISVPTEVQRDAAAIVDAALTEPQRAMLDFERQWWRRPGAKDQAIRDTFGMTPTRYYQGLNALLDLPAALSYDAGLVHRLQRLRVAATRARRLT